MNLQATPEQPTTERAALRFALASGSRPLDGYTIKRGVGRGGFGEVYYAVSDAGKEVALKLIRRNLDIELRGVTQCLNLKHPHLLALYDVKQDAEDNSWVIMEYVAGESLEAIIERHPRGLPLSDALDWMRGIGAGVAYLHDHGIVHRDLKPANIFCDQGMVKLGDYGLAKFISCSRRSGQTESVGTVHYMAPEVANGRYGKQIDIYALGVIFYEMLSGHVPFEGESVGEVLMKHLTAAPDVSRLPEAYRQIVARMLAKDPDVRYASVDEMLAELPTVGSVSSQASLRVVRPVPGLGEAPAPLGAIPSDLPASQNMVVNRGLGRPHAAHTVTVIDEEPIWQATCEACGRLSAWWRYSGLSTPTKLLLAVLAVFVVGANAPKLVAIAVPFLFLYLLYRIVRIIALPPAQNTTAASAQPALTTYHRSESTPVAAIHKSPPAPGGAVYMRPRGMRRQWREQAVAAVMVKPRRERMRELCGSMLCAAGVVAVISFVLMLLRGEPIQPEQYAWLTLVATIGSWAVLAPAKLWEGVKGDAILRRFVMLMTGLAFGAVAFALKQALMVDLPFDFPTPRASSFSGSFGRGFYAADGAPLLYAYLTYFGFLFLCIRWWLQADPLRSSRLSVIATTVCLVAAWVLGQMWTFPQPWGFMVAGAISIAVQLAGPWSPRKARVD